MAPEPAYTWSADVQAEMQIIGIIIAAIRVMRVIVDIRGEMALPYSHKNLSCRF